MVFTDESTKQVDGYYSLRLICCGNKYVGHISPVADKVVYTGFDYGDCIVLAKSDGWRITELNPKRAYCPICEGVRIKKEAIKDER